MSAIDICPDCGHTAAEHDDDGCNYLIETGPFNPHYCGCGFTYLEVEQKVEIVTLRAEITRLAPYYAEVSTNYYAARDELATLRRLLLECWNLTRDDAAPSAELRAMVETLKEGTK